MKWKAYALAAAVTAVLASCGNNSSETEKTTTDTNTVSMNEPGFNNTGINVPENTRTVFNTAYPQASNVRWEYHKPDMEGIEWDWTGWPAMDTADYTASFVWEGSDYMAWYDDQGNWVGTVNTISDHNTLPTVVSGAISKQYNGYTTTAVHKENDKDRTAYEVTLEKGSDRVKVLIDENGKVLKKKTMTAGANTKEKMNPKDTAM